jgi:hypothetical protein
VWERGKGQKRRDAGVGRGKRMRAEGHASAGRGEGTDARDMRAREGRERDTCGRERAGQERGANTGQRVRHARENAGANTKAGKGQARIPPKRKNLNAWSPTVALTEQRCG